MNPRRIYIGVGLFALFISSALPASADPIALFQWVFNLDGTLYDSLGGVGSDALSAAFSMTPPATGAQGLLTVLVNGAGPHSFAGFYDYELDQAVNGFTNEFGAVQNIAAKSLALGWEIDEPGFVFGDIFDHIQLGASALDNSNAVPAGSLDDPSIALGWQFSLLDGQSALISLSISETAPASGFSLAQFDPLSGTGLYYSTSLSIPPAGPPPVAESRTLVVALIGLASFTAAMQTRTAKCRLRRRCTGGH